MGLRELPRHLQVDAAERRVQLRLFGLSGRVFAPYDQWEDYRAGMYTEAVDESHVKGARGVLGHPERCASAMRRATAEWPIAASVNLSNGSCNRRAWMGQAACCVAVGASASSTKRAWWQLTDRQRTTANMIADEVITLWETAQ